MNIKHPAPITQFRYIPLVLGYIAQTSGNISFAEIQTNLTRKNYEIQAQNYDYSLEEGDNLLPPSRHDKGRRTDMYHQLRQILSELMLFGLVEVKDKRNKKLDEFPAQKPVGDVSEYWTCHLTSQGVEMWQLAQDQEKPLEFEARYFTLMFNHFSIVGKFLRAVHNGGKNFVIIPHVTAQELGLEDLDVEKPEGLKIYLDKVTESVLETYYKYTNQPKSGVDDDFHLRRPELENRIWKTIQKYRQRGEKYPRFLIIARIRDYCVSYFAHKLTGDEKISGRSLEALSSRLSKMEIMGYSDYIQRSRGRIIFLCSWLAPFIDAPIGNEISGIYKKFDVELFNTQLQFFAKGQLIFHQPEYYLIKDKFEKSLEETFRDLYRSQRQQFVSIPDIRENVCRDLMISAKTFDRLIIQAFNDSFSDKSDLEITLSSDRSYVEYGLERWHRAPLNLRGVQMTVARVKRKMT